MDDGNIQSIYKKVVVVQHLFMLMCLVLSKLARAGHLRRYIDLICTFNDAVGHEEWFIKKPAL